MRTYALVCPSCERHFEQSAKAADRDTIACPGCGTAPCNTDYAAQTISVRIKASTGPTADDRAKEKRLREEANAQFTKRTSMTHFCRKRDVAKYRAAIGGQAASCIQDDGSVRYRSLDDERRFRRAQEQLDARHEQRYTDKVGQIEAAKVKGEIALPGKRDPKVRKKIQAAPEKLRARHRIG